MLLTIDIGNTNIVYALFDGNNTLIKKWRIHTNLNKTSDEYASQLINLMNFANLKVCNIKASIIGSVVPNLTPIINIMVANYFNHQSILVDEIKDKICDIDIDARHEVGVDRIINSISAFNKLKKSTIIVDLGTATTFDIVSDKGSYLGGIIAPGISLSATSLGKKTAMLPAIEIRKPKNIIGKSTITAIESGIFYGYIGLITQTIYAIKEELLQDYNISNVATIITGGYAKIFINDLDSIEHYLPDLTINGLALIFKNIKNNVYDLTI